MEGPIVRVGGGNWNPETPEAVAERAKASVIGEGRAPVPEGERLFGYWKVRYRGLEDPRSDWRYRSGLGKCLLTAEGQLAS